MHKKYKGFLLIHVLSGYMNKCTLSQLGFFLMRMQVSIGEIRLTWANVEPDSAIF